MQRLTTHEVVHAQASANSLCAGEKDSRYLSS
jgi:hypothetical protein